MAAKTKVVIVISEAVPFAKTGGLADVGGSLPKALAKVGADVTLIMPYYKDVANGGFGEKRVGKMAVTVGANTVHVQVLRAEIPGTKIPAYFLGYDPYYHREGLYQEKGLDYPDNAERYTLLCRGALEIIVAENLKPDCLHLHDWQTGLIPVYLKQFYAQALPRTGTLFTIHNIGYQGNFDKKYFPITNLSWDHFNMRDMEFFGQFSLLKTGIVHADCVSTVSERYAEEIQTPEFGFGMDGVLRYRRHELFGVLNGIDYTVWNPKTDKHVAKPYSLKDLRGKQECKRVLEAECGFAHEPKTMLAGIISRLADQKGFDILVDGIDRILQFPCRYVVLGTGDLKYHRFFEEVAKRHPKQFSLNLRFDDALAHRIYAGADVFLMPSRYEPCGLGQIISMAYGTVPVVRATGGLADTVVDVDESPRDGVGFTFERYTARALVDAVGRSIEAFGKPRRWRNVLERAMTRDFSWVASAKRYLALYQKAHKMAGGR